jgi:hypothetical protein
VVWIFRIPIFILVRNFYICLINQKQIIMSKITEAFKELRKLGYFARQNFWCCQSCAWAAVPDGKDKVVFYHQQDKERLQKTGECHLAWSGDGQEICQVLNRHGITTEWDGTEHKRILMRV